MITELISRTFGASKTRCPYDASFYARVDRWTRHSARRCAPVFHELLGPGSVVDVGCGRGYWLAEFQALGVRDVLGLEGDHLSAAETVLGENQFRNQDLTLSFRLGRTFDLALCLEVAEHLPGRCAGRFVESLTALAPLIIFSAAIPGQGGVDHVNEQWPWYWQEIFAGQGYTRFDPFRRLLWGDPDVTAYYQQNLYLYIKNGHRDDLVERFSRLDGDGLTLVSVQILKQLTRKRSPESLVRRRAGSACRLFRRILARATAVRPLPVRRRRRN